MATQNFFALLENDENDDISSLLARVEAVPAKKPPPPPEPPVRPPAAKLPSKPPPPAQAVREAQADGGRGRGSRSIRGGPRGNYTNRGRGPEGGYGRFNRDGGPLGDQGDYNSRNSGYDTGNDIQGGRGGFMSGGGIASNGDSPFKEDKDGARNYDAGRPRPRGRGRGRGFGFTMDGEERPGRREYDRRSGTGRGNELKRDGAGRGNWGLDTDQNAALDADEVKPEDEKPVADDSVPKKLEDEAAPQESEDVEKKKEVEEEEKEMTLEEYEKVMIEKRKALDALKSQERKVVLDKDFESMQLVDKKSDEEVFLKLGTDKGKRKEVLDKEERKKPPVSINEFLKPPEGEEYYSPTARRMGRGGRGRGDGGRGGFGGGRNNVTHGAVPAPRIEDPGQFPTLGGK